MTDSILPVKRQHPLYVLYNNAIDAYELLRKLCVQFPLQRREILGLESLNCATPVYHEMSPWPCWCLKPLLWDLNGTKKHYKSNMVIDHLCENQDKEATVSFLKFLSWKFSNGTINGMHSTNHLAIKTDKRAKATALRTAFSSFSPEKKKKKIRSAFLRYSHFYIWIYTSS